MSAKYTLARLSIEGEHFEILVKPDPALEYKMGKPMPLSRILVAETIFTDSGKGLRASDEKLIKAFGTLDVMKIAEVILRKGDVQLTTEQRRKLVDEKREQIVDYISRNSVDPRTGFPHPPLRISQAIEQIRVNIDPFIPADEQAKEVISKLRSILPISVEQIQIAVKIPAEYAPQAIGVVKNFGEIKREEWQADGSWVSVVTLSAGAHVNFLDRLGKVTKGGAQTKMLK